MNLPVPSPFPGPIIYHKTTASTMELARIAVASPPEGGVREGTLFWAGHQSEGRGRIEGRRWNSEPGVSLLFTILISRSTPVCPVSAFPLVMGLSAALTLEDWGLNPEIKWPNDIILDHRKAAGILCETRGPWLSAGMGLNLGRSAVPPDLAEKAVSLEELLSEPPRPEAVMERFLQRFHQTLASAEWRDMGEQRLHRRGGEADVVLGLPGPGQEVKTGRVTGIGPQGELLLHCHKEGLFSVFSGEMGNWGGAT